MNRRGFIKALFASAAGIAAASSTIAAVGQAMPSTKPTPSLPEINIVTDSAVLRKNRKLKEVWSLEAQDDLRAWHNLDAERELTRVLAQEINEEIDREVLKDLWLLVA